MIGHFADRRRRLRVAVHHSTRRAFSLAEMMIALVILGLGLLFIAAALPVGLSYTKDTIDRASGDAAARYAGDVVELMVRTDHAYLDPGAAAGQVRLDNLFRPREQNPNGPAGQLRVSDSYEPIIKVRPFVSGNVRVDSTGHGDLVVDPAEDVIARYLSIANPVRSAWGWNGSQPEREYDIVSGDPLSLAQNPAFAAPLRVYPPIEPEHPFRVRDFLGDNSRYPFYGPRSSPGTMVQGLYRSELIKTLDNRIGWSAFYRRVAYDKPGPGPDGMLGSADDVWIRSDPLLYEIVIVITRRPSVNHRFPMQDLSGGNLFNVFRRAKAVKPSAVPNDDAVGADRVVPMPWLIMLNSLDNRAVLAASPTSPGYVNLPDRPLTASFVDPPTLRFRCDEPVGKLLPKGSILIPAVNDEWYGVHGPTPGPGPAPRVAGFAPHAPDTLPIYEVVERPDFQTFIVRNNGAYPWVSESVSSSSSGSESARARAAAVWPVWVIPPAFAERDSNGNPVFEDTSPILAIERRMIRIPEVR
jgi:prepilin-type N-terminal cleavage/methylation domain-containing protein